MADEAADLGGGPSDGIFKTCLCILFAGGICAFDAKAILFTTLFQE